MVRSALIRRSPGIPVFDATPSSFFVPTRWSAPTPARWNGSMFSPAADLEICEEGYRLRLDLPGVVRESLDVSIEEDWLAVSGERPTPPTDGGRGYELRERWAGSFRRRFRLGPDVDRDGISAHFADGVLTLEIPKHAEARRRSIEVH